MDRPYRPRALRVMAEYMDEDPVWDGDLDHVGPVELTRLGVSPRLVDRLRAWNERYKHIARTGFAFGTPDEEDRWRREGLQLAHDLQNELPDIDIRYVHDHDDRPLRERRGP